ncbi:molybdopterin converting factor subunit 1 [Amorphus orientalis]|uniref:Molybdopterin synthase sulfur carrier subunit n=1 Tax=Amorphus orientalis TaxID=649198 RepID=A0AAE4ATV6_9HYPH|nr:molybdopterin converting factor subunit 1 [Amorphus orientalis]MDQ0316753.1 molybdopterin synthase sulfur carrier subunit [Amorphus orientalis]
MRVVYFAWVRERVGVEEEDVDLPADVATAGDLVDWLRTRSPNHAFALEEPRAIRVAVDRVHAQPDAPLAGAREVALFPPMTGG